MRLGALPPKGMPTRLPTWSPPNQFHPINLGSVQSEPHKPPKGIGDSYRYTMIAAVSVVEPHMRPRGIRELSTHS